MSRSVTSMQTETSISWRSSQDEEELWGFENQGDGTFVAKRLWMTLNLDLGGAGLVAADLDGDGDLDLVLPAGDNLEDFDAYPQPYHGCYWFENRGNWDFHMRRIGDLGGTYAAAVGDLDAWGESPLGSTKAQTVDDACRPAPDCSRGRRIGVCRHHSRRSRVARGAAAAERAAGRPSDHARLAAVCR